jgi:hypothetical protein
MLLRRIELIEVEEVIFQMEKGKAPGSDGFTIDFFLSCWDLVKEELWEVVEESRRTRRDIKAFNATFLSLIPKEHGTDNPGKFRPICVELLLYERNLCFCPLPSATFDGISNTRVSPLAFLVMPILLSTRAPI